jgi:hypothetical protein
MIVIGPVSPETGKTKGRKASGGLLPSNPTLISRPSIYCSTSKGIPTILKILITRLFPKLLHLALHADHLFHRQNKGNAGSRFAELSGGFYGI